MATNELNIKDARFDTRLTKAQKQFFERAAQLGGFRNLTDFVILAVQEKAKEIIAENELVLATEKDSELFFNAIFKPANPNKALKNAAEEFNAIVINEPTV